MSSSNGPLWYSSGHRCRTLLQKAQIYSIIIKSTTIKMITSPQKTPTNKKKTTETWRQWPRSNNSTNANWSTKEKNQLIPLDSPSASFNDIMWLLWSRRAADGGVCEERSQFRAQWTSQRWLICPYLWSVISGMENVLSPKTIYDNPLPKMSHVIRFLCLCGVSPVPCWPVSSLLPHTRPGPPPSGISWGWQEMDGWMEEKNNVEGFSATTRGH